MRNFNPFIHAAAFIILQFSFFAHSKSVILNLSSKADQASVIGDPLSFFSASKEQVEGSLCKSSSLPTSQEIEKYIINQSSSKKDLVVNGVKFVNESEDLLIAFKDFTTQKSLYQTDKKDENSLNIQEKYEINPSCDKVVCALEKIWGSQEFALDMLYIYFKYNFNVSEIAFENSSRFNQDELNDVISALQDLPLNLVPVVKKNKRLTHFLRNYTLKSDPDGLIIANATITLFDAWSDRSSAERQYAVFHELSHNISSEFEVMDDSKEWLALSEWEKIDAKWINSSSACFSSRYAKANPAEDFAESMSAYRYNSESFKKNCPEKYEFLRRKIFDEIEYTSAEKCLSLSSSKIDLLHERINQEVIPFLVIQNFTKEEIKKSCKNNFVSYPLTENEVTGCFLKLYSSKSNGTNKIVQIMNEENVFNSKYNLNLIVETFVRDLSQLSQLEKIELAEKVTPLFKMLQTMINDSFLAANPDGFTQRLLNENDYIWTKLLNKCGKHFFSGKMDLLISCQIKNIINDDKTYYTQNDLKYFKEYKIPALFRTTAQDDLILKREDVLLKYLLNHEVAKKITILQQEKLTSYLRFHVTEVNSSFPENWQKMSPELFCSATYAKTKFWLQMLGYSLGEIIPELQNNCERLQATRPKRFIINSESSNTLLI
jgi:hypothetical protein